MFQQIDSNNVKLSGEIEGSFYPSRQSEILRNIILQEPFYIRGGLFAQNIGNINGGVVEGPVLATAEITLSHPSSDGKPLKFLSGINATLSISITESGLSIEDTVVSDLQKSSIIVRGDVVSDSVKLDNALILGNVRAREASIVNSVVVGSLFIEENLILENTSFVALSAGRVSLRGYNGCWLPYATALEPIKFELSQVSDSEQTFAELRYFALCRSPQMGCGFQEGAIACKSFVTGSCPYHQVQLNEADIRPHKTENGTSVYALNLAQRALNLKPVEEEIRQVEEFLREMLIYEHLDKMSQDHVRNQWREKLRPEEKELLSLGLEVGNW